jgi:hypothetical protein
MRHENHCGLEPDIRRGLYRKSLALKSITTTAPDTTEVYINMHLKMNLKTLRAISIPFVEIKIKLYSFITQGNRY